MNYFTPQKKPKILLVNFTKEDLKNLLKEGFNVELGLVAVSEKEGGRDIEYYFESPPFEYDIYIYNSEFEGDPIKFLESFPKRLSSEDGSKKMREDFKDLVSTPLKLAFIGKNFELTNLAVAGLPNFKTEDADTRLKELIVVEANQTFSLSELKDFIEKYKFNILPVYKYISEISEGHPRNRHPYNNFSLIVNKRGEQIANYTTVYTARGVTPLSLVLPQFKDNLKVIINLLGLLTKIRPDLFPEIKEINWIDSEEFDPDEVTNIRKKIKERYEETEKFIKEQQNLIEEEKEKTSFLKDILVAKGDEKLKPSVKKILEILDFEVIDSDIIEKGKKKQDLIISNGTDYKALVEIKGTVKQNAPDHFYSQLLGHLRKSHNPSLRGLLIVDYDANTHAFQRVPIYKDSEELFSEESDVGVLSTVELYKIIRAVRKNIITKEQAREILKRPNRIIFNTEQILKEKDS